MDRFGMSCMKLRHLPPGTVLEGRYIIVRLLGINSLSAVYLGYDRVLYKNLTIKEYLPIGLSVRMSMHPKITIHPGDREERFLFGMNKFIEEARRLAKFQNVPGIIYVYGCFEANSTAYIIMEYQEGETLEELLDREEKVSVKQALPIIFDILHALEAVHREGILHRDISPSNIFITKNGEAKLLNFGAARLTDAVHNQGLTVLVKPGFAPEEQYHSRGEQGTWTDVYAVAATFYQMISGVTPEEALERTVGDTLKAPSKLGVEIGPSTEMALMNALNISIEGRTRTAKQFEEELLANVVKRVAVKNKGADTGWRIFRGKPAIGARAVILGLSAVFLVMSGIHYRGAAYSTESVPQGMCRVPNVVNEELGEAVERGGRAGLTVRVYGRQYNKGIPADRVLSQSIKGGSVVAVNEALDLVISAGRE